MHFESKHSLRSRNAVFSAIILLATSACVLAPGGYDHERDRAVDAGRPYEKPAEERSLPDLPATPTWRAILERAFLANGELEAAYFDWRAAVERVEAAAGWPNTDLMPSFSYMLSSGSMKAWDRTTVNLGFDASENLQLPIKTRKAAEVALAEARAAAERFRGGKFALQRRVLGAWLDLALAEEQLRIGRTDLELVRIVSDTAAPRVQAGAPQQDLVRAGIEAREAENRLRSLEADARSKRALLNGLLARAPDAPVEFGANLPESRHLPGSDADLLALGVDASPELAAMSAEVAGREDALELARLMYIPNFNPFAGFTGSVSQVVGVAVMLPTTLPEIRSGIAEARAMLAGSRAMQRQAKFERKASFVAALVMLRNSEREAEFLEQQVLPSATLLLETSQQSYAAGSASLLDLVEAQRTLLELRLMIAEARIEREQRIAELEELAGIDVESLAATVNRSKEEGESHGNL